MSFSVSFNDSARAPLMGGGGQQAQSPSAASRGGGSGNTRAIGCGSTATQAAEVGSLFSMFEAFIPFFAGGRIFATTDKPYYVPGELVTGSIIADLSQPIAARGIDLTCSGYEKTEWHEIRNEQQRPEFGSSSDGPPAPPVTIQKVHRHRGRKEFFKDRQRIYNIAGGMMQPGQHRFPFSYQLPEGIPGSFYERQPMPHVQDNAEYEDDDFYNNSFADSDDEDEAAGGQHDKRNHGRRAGLLAVVMYKLNVTLECAGFFHPDLKCRVPLIIHPKLSVGVTPAVSQLSSQVTVCCCLNKGTASVNAHFDKTAYTRGETAQITAEIDNQSTQTLSMAVKLFRTIELNSGQGSRRRGNKVVRECIAQQKYEAVPAMNKLVREMPLALNTDAVKPTTSGELVKCSYEYAVECAISMGKDITLKMPVVVYAPQPRPIQMQSP